MLHIGDYVVSSVNGICKIEEEVERSWSGENRLYFALIPIKEKESKIYIPVENAEQRVRKAMTQEEAREFIGKLKSTQEIPVENEKMCEKEYKAAVYSGDPMQVARVIKTIYLRKQKRTALGKKATVIDDRYYRLAIHILHSELAYALGCNEENVESKIKELIDKKH